ncbi:MAG: hypothetical protein ACI807_001582 [Paracoccaceae bacterium]|jgi:hypothetical protein
MVPTWRPSRPLAGVTDPGGGAVISFDGALFGSTLLLDHGALEIASSMQIVGYRAIAPDAQGLARVMHVAANIELDLSGMTLAGGAADGNGGAVMVESGAFAEARQQSLIVADNLAGGLGSGIYVAGDVVLEGGEIARNTADWGGGIGIDGGSLEMTNSTVHSNAASSGADVLGTGVSFVGGNIVGRSIAALDPLVVVLANEGIALTDVFAVIDGLTGGGLATPEGGFGQSVALVQRNLNPALGAADPDLYPCHDGRFVLRDPRSADLGAFELSADEAPSLIVTTEADVTDRFDGVISLREAVGWLNDGVLTGTITFAAGATFLTEGALIITGAVAIDGGVAQVLADQGLTLAHVFATLDALGGQADGNGGFGSTVALSSDLQNPVTGGAIGGVDTFDLDLDSDGVTAEPLPTDARGVARAPAHADLGTYEAPGTDLPSLHVTTMLDIVNDSDNLTSLREAIAWAATGVHGDTITFAQGGRVLLTGGQLTVGSAMTIDGDVDGDGTADVTIDAHAASRVMELTAGADLRLEALVLTGGSVGDGVLGLSG